jgi:beta-glucosidase
VGVSQEPPAGGGSLPPLAPAPAEERDEPTRGSTSRMTSGAEAPALVEGPGIHASNFQFPRGFLWGASTSAHQVEGNCTNNDWWAWEQAGRVREPSGLACDHFHRFREDFDLAHQLRHNAHRFSLEWSRIEPEEGRFSGPALAHYRQVLQALVERDIEPVVTLHHYTLPRWLADRGGWENPAIEDHFERYVRRALDAYGDLARWWITLNEPTVHVYKSFILGQWPPGKKEFPAAVRAMRHMLRAHVRAYHAIHERRMGAKVSVAMHALALRACNPRSIGDNISVWWRGHLVNHLFLDALHTGVMRVPGLFWERLPVKKTLDFIGLNYYTRDFVKNSGFVLPGLLGVRCILEHHQDIGKRSALGWEIYPEGLAYFLKAYRRYRLPILITENGVAARQDEDRWVFLLLHLWQVARAISIGTPVIGYLHWSLLDNFEWADGYAARFGLIGVDYATQNRTVRDSARAYAEVIERNEL